MKHSWDFFDETNIKFHTRESQGDIDSEGKRVVAVLLQEEGNTAKYSLSTREIPRAKPKGNPEGKSQGISQILRQYFTVYPDTSHNIILILLYRFVKW